MVERRMMFRSSTGRAFDDWAAAAADEAELLLAQLLPDSCVQREDLARQMARALFIDRNERSLRAWAGVIETMQSEPSAESPDLRVIESGRWRRPWRNVKEEG